MYGGDAGGIGTLTSTKQLLILFSYCVLFLIFISLVLLKQSELSLQE